MRFALDAVRVESPVLLVLKATKQRQKKTYVKNNFYQSSPAAKIVNLFFYRGCIEVHLGLPRHTH